MRFLRDLVLADCQIGSHLYNTICGACLPKPTPQEVRGGRQAVGVSRRCVAQWPAGWMHVILTSSYYASCVKPNSKWLFGPWEATFSFGPFASRWVIGDTYGRTGHHHFSVCFPYFFFLELLSKFFTRGFHLI